MSYLVVETKVLFDDKVIATFPTVDNTKTSTLAAYENRGRLRVQENARVTHRPYFFYQKRLANLRATSIKVPRKTITTGDIEIYDNINWADVIDLIRLHAHHGRTDVEVKLFEYWTSQDPFHEQAEVISSPPEVPSIQTRAAAPPAVLVAPLLPIALAPTTSPQVEAPPPYSTAQAAATQAASELHRRRTATEQLREGYIPVDRFFVLAIDRYKCEKPHCEHKAKGCSGCYRLPNGQHLPLDGLLISRWWNLCKSRGQEPDIESPPSDIVGELLNLATASTTRRRSNNSEASPPQHHHYYAPPPSLAPPYPYPTPQVQVSITEARPQPLISTPPPRSEDHSSPVDVPEAHAEGSLPRYGVWLGNKFPGQRFDIMTACEELEGQGYQLDQLRRMDEV